MTLVVVLVLGCMLGCFFLYLEEKKKEREHLEEIDEGFTNMDL